MPSDAQPGATCYLCCIQLRFELLLLLLLVCLQLLQAGLRGAQLVPSCITQLTQTLNLQTYEMVPSNNQPLQLRSHMHQLTHESLSCPERRAHMSGVGQFPTCRLHE
jgi:hypothetical protein